jgi:hypothetical protein
MIALQDRNDLLRLDIFRDSGEVPDVAEEARDVAAMSIKKSVSFVRDDQIGYLWRQELFQASEPISSSIE